MKEKWQRSLKCFKLIGIISILLTFVGCFGITKHDEKPVDIQKEKAEVIKSGNLSKRTTAGTEPSIRIFYRTDWSTPKLHFNGDGKGWTTLPGISFNDTGYFTGYKEITITVSAIEFVINNGNNVWDNPPGGGNYHINAPGIYKLESGIITPLNINNRIEIIYTTGWTNSQIHYKADSGNWTVSPGIKMVNGSQTDLRYAAINASSLEFVLNDGNNSNLQWDHAPGGGNYKISSVGSYKLQSGIITRILEIPSGIVNTVSNSSVSLKWTKVEGAKGYKVYKSTSWDGSYSEVFDTGKIINLHYKTSWNAKLHYNADNKGWTASPGLEMTDSLLISGYKYSSINASLLEFVPNNGNGVWDHAPGGGNYFIRSGGDYKLEDGIITPLSISEFNFTDTDILRGQTYFYKVKAYDESSSSDFSDTSIANVSALQNLVIVKDGNLIRVRMDVVCYGLEVSINKEITDSAITFNNQYIKSSNSLIGYRQDNATIVGGYSKDTPIPENTDIFVIDTDKVDGTINTQDLSYFIKELFLTSDDWKSPSNNTNTPVSFAANSFSVQSVGTETLLGDINNDGEVGLLDFAAFYIAYGPTGTYNIKADIAPAQYGQKSGWQRIYSFAQPDGVVGIVDFVVFAKNYGKTTTEKDYTVSLTANKTKLISNGTDSVSLSCIVKDGDGNIQTNSYVDIYVNGIEWQKSKNSFSTNVSGDYKIRAVFNGYESNEILVNASSPLDDIFTIELQANPLIIKANGSDKTDLTIILKDGKGNIRDNANVRLWINSVEWFKRTYSTLGIGFYKIKATYLEQKFTSNEVTIQAIDPINKTIDLTLNKDKINANGEDSLNINGIIKDMNGVVISNEYPDIYIKKNSEVPFQLFSDTFYTYESGTYTVIAKYPDAIDIIKSFVAEKKVLKTLNSSISKNSVLADKSDSITVNYKGFDQWNNEYPLGESDITITADNAIITGNKVNTEIEGSHTIKISTKNVPLASSDLSSEVSFNAYSIKTLNEKAKDELKYQVGTRYRELEKRKLYLEAIRDLKNVTKYLSEYERNTADVTYWEKYKDNTENYYSDVLSYLEAPLDTFEEKSKERKNIEKVYSDWQVAIANGAGAPTDAQMKIIESYKNSFIEITSSLNKSIKYTYDMFPDVYNFKGYYSRYGETIDSMTELDDLLYHISSLEGDENVNISEYFWDTYNAKYLDAKAIQEQNGTKEELEEKKQLCTLTINNYKGIKNINDDTAFDEYIKAIEDELTATGTGSLEALLKEQGYTTPYTYASVYYDINKLTNQFSYSVLELYGVDSTIDSLYTFKEKTKQIIDANNNTYYIGTEVDGNTVSLIMPNVPTATKFIVSRSTSLNGTVDKTIDCYANETCYDYGSANTKYYYKAEAYNETTKLCETQVAEITTLGYNDDENEMIGMINTMFTNMSDAEKDTFIAYLMENSEDYTFATNAIASIKNSGILPAGIMLKRGDISTILSLETLRFIDRELIKLGVRSLTRYAIVGLTISVAASETPVGWVGDAVAIGIIALDFYVIYEQWNEIAAIMQTAISAKHPNIEDCKLVTDNIYFAVKQPTVDEVRKKAGESDWATIMLLFEQAKAKGEENQNERKYPYVVNVQAQGPDIPDNWKNGQGTIAFPMADKKSIKGKSIRIALEVLQTMLTPSQYKKRNQAFTKANKTIDKFENANPSGWQEANGSKSHYNDPEASNSEKGIRVDLENKIGLNYTK